MSRYECVQLVSPTDPDYVRWSTKARERRVAQKKTASSDARTVRPTPTTIASSTSPHAREASNRISTPAVVTPSATSTPKPATVIRLHAAQLSAPPTRPSVPPLVRAAFGRRAESVVRQSLGSVLPVWDRRILRYAVRNDAGRWVTRYRELDVVAREGRRLYIFEVKTTTSPDTIRRGVDQLSFVRDVLATSYFDVITTLVVIDMSPKDSSFLRDHLAQSPKLVQVTWLAELTTNPVIHAIRKTRDDVATMASSLGIPLSIPTAA